jgi:RNA polymerase sigma factor (sigma-70 family)
MEDRLPRGLPIEDRLSRKVEELFDRHGRALTEFAYFLTGDPDLAQDIVQDAFVRLFARFGHVRKPDAIDSYLRQTVVNLSRSYFPKRRSERVYLQRERALQARDVSHSPEHDEDTFWLLQDLPAKQRAAVVLSLLL